MFKSRLHAERENLRSKKCFSISINYNTLNNYQFIKNEFRKY